MKRVGEVSAVFLRFGLLSFGGPLAAMGMMQEELCRRRQWVDEEQFSEIYAICKLLPGPVAAQMAIYLGTLRAGRIGGVLAGALYVLPSFIIVLIAAVLQEEFAQGPATRMLFAGLQAAALAVIFASVIQLGRPYRAVPVAWAVAVAAAFAVWLRPSFEPLYILGAGVAGAFAYRRRTSLSGRKFGVGGAAFLVGALWARPRIVFAATLTASAPFVPARLLDLFWVCFKAGAFVFGSGLAIVPLLEADVVQHYHWLTHAEFMDGLAIGQVTPGPVVITATYIGYRAASWVGAVVATAGMFLPSFFNVLFLVPRIRQHMRGNPAAAGFTSWAIPAVVGCVFGTALHLGALTLTSPILWGTFGGSLVAAIGFRVPSWVVIPAAGVLTALFSGMI